MQCLLLLSFLVGFAQPVEEGRTVHLRGRNFSLQLVEPEGWTLDTTAASQLANFILYPHGEDWRSAPGLISVRLEPRRSNQTVEDYVKIISQAFEENCPFGEHAARESEVDARFNLFDFRCPGRQEEIIAITSVPEFFVNISLSSQRPELLEEHYPVFQIVLESFEWQQELSQPALITPNRR